MEKLKEDYKDSYYVGSKEYKIIKNGNDTFSIEDVTNYTEEGDEFGAEDINLINSTINKLFDIIRPVGSYFFTSDTKFNPNDTWPGTWELEEDGTTLSSRYNVSDGTSSILNAEVGTIVGEASHKLLKEEQPHLSGAVQTRSWNNSDNIIDTFPQGDTEENVFKFNKKGGESWNIKISGAANASGPTDVITYDNGGQDIPFNIVQPTKISNRWHRIA